MNNSLSAHQQVLIKKSGRTIECLARNSDVGNLKVFLFEVPFIYPLNSNKQQQQQQHNSGKQGQTSLIPSKWQSFSSHLQQFSGTKGLTILFSCDLPPGYCI